MKNNYFMKTTLTTFLSLLFFLPFSTEALASEKLPKSDKKVNYLFVQSANRVKIEVNKKHPHTYKITLKNVNPYVTYFSDRPNRETNTMSTEKFIRLWHRKGDNLSKNPPNADLVATQVGFFSDHKLINFVVELTEPHYDPKAKTLTYIAKPLKGSTLPPIHSVTLHHVFLFIDDVCLSCWGD